jgi:hypothetical protein
MAHKANGHAIANSLTDVRVDTLLPGAILKRIPCLSHVPDATIVSDLSDFKAAIVVLNGNLPISDNRVTFTFSDEELATSSGVRELLAVSKAIAHFKERGLRRTNIMWLKDSENVVPFLSKGATKLKTTASIQMLLGFVKY